MGQLRLEFVRQFTCFVTGLPADTAEYTPVTIDVSNSSGKRTVTANKLSKVLSIIQLFLFVEYFKRTVFYVRMQRSLTTVTYVTYTLSYEATLLFRPTQYNFKFLIL